jgi:4-amino-4-deoxy-L-arabinose transferase-like glycosyltransferase
LLSLFFAAIMAEKVEGPGAGGRTALMLTAFYSILKQSRLATYDSHLLAWVCMGCAGMLLMAERPSSLPQRIAGGLLAGVGCMAAIFTKGPVGLLVPALAWSCGLMWLDRKRFHLRPAALPLLIAITAYACWYLHVVHDIPGARGLLLAEWVQDREKSKPWYYYLVVVGMVFPWTLLALRSLLHRAGPGDEARLSRYPWLVTVGTIALLMLSENKRHRYLIPALPFVAMALQSQWHRLAAAKPGETHPLERAHLIVLGLISAGLALMFPLQPTLLRLGMLSREEFPGAGIPAALLTAGISGLLIYLMSKALHEGKRELLLPLTAAWLATVWTLGMHFYSESYHGKYVHRDVAARLQRLSLRHPLILINPQPNKPLLDDRLLYQIGNLLPAVDAGPYPPQVWILMEENQADAPQGWKKVEELYAHRNLALYAPELPQSTPPPHPEAGSSN